MPAKFGAGQMIERFAFDQREQIDDGFGNIVSGPWQEQFQERAKIIFLRGSETVMAGRLQSRESIIVQVYLSSQTRRIDADWQARDVRRGETYNVRTLEEDKSRLVLDILCESNVAA